MKKFLFLLPLAITAYLPQSFTASQYTPATRIVQKNDTIHLPLDESLLSKPISTTQQRTRRLFYQRFDRTNTPDPLDLTKCHDDIQETILYKDFFLDQNGNPLLGPDKKPLYRPHRNDIRIIENLGAREYGMQLKTELMKAKDTARKAWEKQVADQCGVTSVRKNLRHQAFIRFLKTRQRLLNQNGTQCVNCNEKIAIEEITAEFEENFSLNKKTKFSKYIMPTFKCSACKNDNADDDATTPADE